MICFYFTYNSILSSNIQLNSFTFCNTTKYINVFVDSGLISLKTSILCVKGKFKFKDILSMFFCFIYTFNTAIRVKYNCLYTVNQLYYSVSTCTYIGI